MGKLILAGFIPFMTFESTRNQFENRTSINFITRGSQYRKISGRRKNVSQVEIEYIEPLARRQPRFFFLLSINDLTVLSLLTDRIYSTFSLSLPPHPRLSPSLLPALLFCFLLEEIPRNDGKMIACVGGCVSCAQIQLRDVCQRILR